MLLGGATTDRLSSRTVMLASNVARCAIVCVMTFLVFTNAARLWHLYVLSAAFGIFDAFFYPAYVSILPALLEPEQLRSGNSLMQSSAQLTGLIGPTVAGVIISTAGLSAVFGLDAASFLASITMLSLISIAAKVGTSEKKASLLASIREGVHYVLRHPAIRSMLIASAVMNLFLTGPFMIGAPLLAKLRFGGAISLGLLYSSFGAGGLMGALVAGHDRRQHRLGPLFVAVYTAAGATMIALGLIWHFWIACVVLFLLGLIVGYSNIHMMAFLQRQTEPDKMGRVMSLLMFCAQGLLPLSYVMSGVVSEISAVVLFVSSGVIIIAITAVIFRPAPFWEKP
jgi:MFS family permease